MDDVKSPEHSQEWITPVSNLVEFFQKEFERSCERMGLETSKATEAYVVHMLDGFLRLTPEMSSELGFDKPAALLLSDAVHSAGEQRIDAYRRLGDACLYNCGFFQSRLTRRGVKASYYRQMGQNVYQDLARLMRYKQPGGVFGQIFGELSGKFDEIVVALKTMTCEEEVARKEKSSKTIRFEDLLLTPPAGKWALS